MPNKKKVKSKFVEPKRKKTYGYEKSIVKETRIDYSIHPQGVLIIEPSQSPLFFKKGQVIISPTPIRKDLPGCEECPSCHHFTLPVIKQDSHATGRMCSNCRVIVNREGRIENG